MCVLWKEIIITRNIKLRAKISEPERERKYKEMHREVREWQKAIDFLSLFTQKSEAPIFVSFCLSL